MRCFTATVPGNGGAPPVPAATFEERARQGSLIAAALGCQVVVGHSLGANVALEMVCFSDRSPAACWGYARI